MQVSDVATTHCLLHTCVLWTELKTAVSCIQSGSCSKDELADKVVLKQFLDRIVLRRADMMEELEPEDRQRALVGNVAFIIYIGFKASV